MSKEFQPSISAAKDVMGDNLRIEQRLHPSGSKGAAVSLDEVSKRIREGRLDPRVRAWAGKVLFDAGKPKDARDQAQAILDAVRERTVYALDPVGAEYMVEAKNTLCLDEQGLCFKVGDCFPKNTLILTQRFGLIPIERLEPGLKIWGRDEWTTVEAVADKGILSIDAIVLNNGSIIKLTSDHHVYIAACSKHEYACECDEKYRSATRVRVNKLAKDQVLLRPEQIPVANKINHCRPKLLCVKAIEKNIAEVQCYDIQTEDHYVYLPEHDVTVSNCDDLTIALGASLMSVGIPVKVVGQSFNSSSVPTHVMLAAYIGKEWKRIDPSSSTFKVGEAFHATKETWIDPLDLIPTSADNLGLTAGDFIGVGKMPSIITVGVGDLSFIGREEIFNTVTAQLRDALDTLEKSVDDLGNSLNQIEETRALLTPDKPFDAEPFPITGLDNFPTNGLWTKSMATISVQIWTVGKTLVHAGKEALDGARRILIDENTKEVYIEAKEDDPWRIHTIVDKVTDKVIGFFSSVGELISGFTARDGKALSKDQVDKEIQTGIVHGPPGVGAIPVAIIVAGVAVTAAIASVAIYYIVAKQCDNAMTVAKEATNKAIVDCVTSGKCTSVEGAKMLETLTKGRVEEAKAEAARNRTDPLGNSLEKIGTIITWTIVGGVAAAGLYVATPYLEKLVGKAVKKFDANEDLSANEWQKYFDLGRTHGNTDYLQGHAGDILASAIATRNLPKNYDAYMAYAEGYIEASRLSTASRERTKIQEWFSTIPRNKTYQLSENISSNWPSKWYHGSPYSGMKSMADYRGRIMFLSDSLQVAQDYTRTLLASGRRPSNVPEGPVVYEVRLNFGPDAVFDTRRHDHYEMFLKLGKQARLRDPDEGFGKSDLIRVPAAPGSRIGGDFPSFGLVIPLMKLLNHEGFKGAFIGEGSQGASLAVLDPQRNTTFVTVMNSRENPISKVKYRGFDITLYQDSDGDWIGDISRKGDPEHFVGVMSLTKDGALSQAQTKIDKALK